MFGILLFTIFLLFVTWSFLKLHRRGQFFNERNVKHFKPNFFLGNIYEVLLGKRHVWESMHDLYCAFPEEELVGYYDLLGPHLIVRCPDLAESILAKNFSHFHDRIFQTAMIDTPQDANLFSLTGNTWRAVRHKLSPLFTTGKLKFMYPSIVDCGKSLVSLLEEKEAEDVEVSEVMGLFASDVIGSTAFGIEANLLHNPDSKFRLMAKQIFGATFARHLAIATFMLFPKFAKMLNINGIVSNDVSEYFYDIIRKTLKERSEKGTGRNDFVQMLLTLKQKGKIEIQIHESGDDYLIQDTSNDTFELEITDNILIGGAFTFFVAGFHPTSMTMTYTLFELSQYPEVEAKLREEIASVVQGEDPTYEELRKMSYLESVLKESMRLHPTLLFIGRVCTKEFTTPRGFKFEPGQLVSIPIQSIQTDPNYWPDPLVFNPDRFLNDTPPRLGTYYPFGGGPRICIAMRFAMLEMKFALVKLLMNYKFQLSEKTKLPLKLHPRMLLATPANKIYFQVKKLK